MPESDEVRKQYNKTHQSWLAGEHSTREYKWPKAVSGDNHRFGMFEVAKDSNNNGLGVKTALSMDVGSEQLSVPGTKIVEASLEHFRQAAKEHVGTSRMLLQNERQLPENHVFGAPSSTEAVGAAVLIHKSYTAAEQQPDDDLGRCTARGRRNFLTPEPLGVPTVRADLPKRPQHLRSVANTTNFGDDATARGLVAPGKFQGQNIFDEDFLQRRTPDELQEILKGAGYELPDEEFKAVARHATELCGGDEGASVQALMVAYTNHVGRASSAPGRCRS
eukprot:SRR837773.12714.p2 GENE.SRR837773.12714~~SRR837773.12714.p2  ORF type:complete len:277 (-),score=105.69 SRR837773.12714:1-831(-)